MSQHLLLYKTQAEYEETEGGTSSTPNYVFRAGSRLDLISGNSLPAQIDDESGATEFLGDGYYLLKVYDSASTGLLGQYVLYPEGDLPSGTSITIYGQHVRSGNTWVWDETPSHTEISDGPVFCALHNGKRCYSYNDPKQFGFKPMFYENDEIPGTYKSVRSAYNTTYLVTPKNYIDGITSVVPGVGYINDDSKAVKYNVKSLPKLDLLRSQSGTSITWEEYGITDETYAKYRELASHGDSLLETFNVTLDNENLMNVHFGFDLSGIAFGFNDSWYIAIRPEDRTIIIGREEQGIFT